MNDYCESGCCKKCLIAALEAELEHATAIAAVSIGQPDRATNVAYREEIRHQLQLVRQQVSVRPAQTEEQHDDAVEFAARILGGTIVEDEAQ